MIKNVFLLIATCAVLFFLSSCSSGNSDVDLTGGWDATITYSTDRQNAEEFSLTFTFYQDSDEIFGHYASSDGSSGRVHGQMFDRSFELTVSQEAPCVGTFRLEATLANERKDNDVEDNDEGTRREGFRNFTGTFIGADCIRDISGGITGRRTSN